jgi:hypothetical protein
MTTRDHDFGMSEVRVDLAAEEDSEELIQTKEESGNAKR